MAEVKIAADSGGGSVGLVGPASTTSNAALQFKLPVADGSANQLLKTDGSGNLGWIASAVGGKILQVVGTTLIDKADTSNTSWTATSHVTPSLTPSAADSKILVIFAGTFTSGNTNHHVAFATLYHETGGDDSWSEVSNVGSSSTGLVSVQGTGGASVHAPCTIVYLDSPNTTSAKRYKVYIRSEHSNSTCSFPGKSGNRVSAIAMEIGA